jgi:hypothetical protein
VKGKHKKNSKEKRAVRGEMTEMKKRRQGREIKSDLYCNIPQGARNRGIDLGVLSSMHKRACK